MKVRLGKATPQRDVRLYPLTSGTHTVEELAVLIQQGKTLRDIAVLWGMRPMAGARDLSFDLDMAWESAGCPGGIPRPKTYGPDMDAAWSAWNQARTQGIESWLDTFLSPQPVTHCPTCTCDLPDAPQED